MHVLELSLESKESTLSGLHTTRRFQVHEGMSTLFDVELVVTSKDDDVAMAPIVGKGASFRAVQGAELLLGIPQVRVWTGIVNHFEQTRCEPKGLSTYALRIVPTLWLATQRRNNRIFQHQTIPDIVDKLLAEWKITPAWKIDRPAYRKLEYRVQYGESDFTFLSRLLEEAGICYYFAQDEKKGSVLTFADKANGAEPRSGGPIKFAEHANEADREFVTHVRIAHDVRPGAFTIRDFDFRRKPDYPLLGKAPAAAAPEDRLEQFHYRPGAFVVDDAKPGDTPVADDRGVARWDDKQGEKLATMDLDAVRGPKRTVQFSTNLLELSPGTVFSMYGHPHGDVGPEKKLLVTDLQLSGGPTGQWHAHAQAHFAEHPYRAPDKTPKPTIHGVQSAIVVGPKGEEIHTDEFGRVRVQFHWDREGKYDETSSCWIRVSQSWAGHGFGMIMLPRIGQEVLVGFFEGNPDQPVIVGRVYNNTTRVPYKLPDHKTRSTWKSDSSPNSNGFNEIMFEDAKGKELVYVQAQRDLKKLVKHDESEQIGNSRAVVVGNNRSTQVGAVDSLTVGKKHSILMAQKQDPPPSLPPTGLDMVDKKLTYTTGEATVIMDGPNISMEAKGNITIKSTGGDVIILGSLVKINSP
jgi:type VI secretion system secreted protein VgrG